MQNHKIAIFVSKQIITIPGKFEGQATYIPYYWDIYLDGFADNDDGKIISFRVNAEDKLKFPCLRYRKVIKLMEDSQGFVIEV
jgi:hypothetical protein